MKKYKLSIGLFAIATLFHQGAYSFLTPCAPLLAPAKAVAVNAMLASRIKNLTGSELQDILGSKVLKKYKNDLCKQDGSIKAFRLNAAQTHLVVGGHTLRNSLNKEVLNSIDLHVTLDKFTKDSDKKEEAKKDREKSQLTQRQREVSLMKDSYDQAWIDYAVKSQALYEAEAADVAFTKKQLDEQAWESPCNWDKPKENSFDWKEFVKDNKERMAIAGIVAAGAGAAYVSKDELQQKTTVKA